MTRTHPVSDPAAHARAVSEYRRDGYRIDRDTGDRTTLTYAENGSLLTHLALFFTVGWLTFGLANWAYSRRRKAKTYDRVEIVTR